MSDYINRIEMQGKVQNIDTKKFATGKERCSFSLVIEKAYGDKVYTNKFQCTYWGSVTLRDNDFVRIVGELKNESWETQTGERKYRTIINVFKAYSIFPVTMEQEHTDNIDTTNGLLSPMAYQSNNQSNEYLGDDEPIF